MIVLSAQARSRSSERGVRRMNTPSPFVLAIRWRDPTAWLFGTATTLGGAAGWDACAAATAAGGTPGLDGEPMPNGIVMLASAASPGTGDTTRAIGVAVATAWALSWPIGTLASSLC